jgi:hypothetical protein
MHTLLALARTESFVVRRDECHYALVDHDAAVTTCVLAIDLLYANQFGSPRWRPSRYMYQYQYLLLPPPHLP